MHTGWYVMRKLVRMTKKNPSHTRQSLLTAAFREVYRKGFQSASMEQILEKTDVTKGALYYHFRSKRDLGLAVLHDLIREAVDKTFLEPLRHSENPVDGLVRSITQACEGLSDEEIELGCPLNNLALEMSPVDEAFRHVIGGIYDQWRGEIAQALKRGQARRLVRRDVDSDGTAAFIVAALAGCRSMAKNTQSREMLLACARQLCRYLETLKVQSKSRKEMSHDSSRDTELFQHDAGDRMFRL